MHHLDPNYWFPSPQKHHGPIDRDYKRPRSSQSGRVLHQLGIFPFFGRMESPSPISKHEERSKFNEREAEKIFFIPLFTKEILDCVFFFFFFLIRSYNVPCINSI